MRVHIKCVRGKSYRIEVVSPSSFIYTKYVITVEPHHCSKNAKAYPIKLDRMLRSVCIETTRSVHQICKHRCVFFHSMAVGFLDMSVSYASFYNISPSPSTLKLSYSRFFMVFFYLHHNKSFDGTHNSTKNHFAAEWEKKSRSNHVEWLLFTDKAIHSPLRYDQNNVYFICIKRNGQKNIPIAFESWIQWKYTVKKRWPTKVQTNQINYAFLLLLVLSAWRKSHSTSEWFKKNQSEYLWSAQKPALDYPFFRKLVWMELHSWKNWFYQ